MFAVTKRLRNGGILLIGILATGALATVHPVKEFLKTVPGYTASKVFFHNLSNPVYAPAEIGDGEPATRIVLIDPAGIAIDSNENIFLSDRIGIIWKIDPNGRAHVIAGTGRRGRAQPGVNALLADLGAPQALAIDSQDRLYFADSVNHVVLRIAADGSLERIAGDGRLGYRGDSGPAIEASLYTPFDIRFDSRDGLYIVEFGNHRVRKIDEQGFISTVAGGDAPGYSGDDGPAESARLRGPYGAYVDNDGRLYIADSGNNVIRKVDDNGIIQTIAGSGTRGYAGDGGSATEALMDSPQFLVVDESNRIIVGDEHNHAIREVTPDGTISTLVGGRAPITSDKGRANAQHVVLDDPEALLLLSDGSLLIVDGGHARVIRLQSDGTIEHFAGRGTLEDASNRSLDQLIN